MTFTKTPPQQPGFYVWREGEISPTKLRIIRLTDIEPLIELCGGEWCRLVPAEEVEKAYREGMKGMNNVAVGMSYDFSRARRVAEGSEL